MDQDIEEVDAQFRKNIVRRARSLSASSRTGRSRHTQHQESNTSINLTPRTDASKPGHLFDVVYCSLGFFVATIAVMQIVATKY